MNIMNEKQVKILTTDVFFTWCVLKFIMSTFPYFANFAFARSRRYCSQSIMITRYAPLAKAQWPARIPTVNTRKYKPQNVRFRCNLSFVRFTSAFGVVWLSNSTYQKVWLYRKWAMRIKGIQIHGGPDWRKKSEVYESLNPAKQTKKVPFIVMSIQPASIQGWWWHVIQVIWFEGRR